MFREYRTRDPLHPAERYNVKLRRQSPFAVFPELGRKFASARLLNVRVEIQRRFANRGEMMRIGANDDDDGDD